MLTTRHVLTTATASRHVLRIRSLPRNPALYALYPAGRRYLHPAPIARQQKSDEQSSQSPAAPAPAPVPAQQKQPLLPRVWAKVKHEASHYWHGSKLLVSEIRISRRLLFKLLRGNTLTRREYRQLRRTTQDLLRLIPFAVFVIVPFMEFLLPVALKLFPNMLPSTFEDKFAAEEKARKLLRIRIEMAKFLQETIRESGLKANAKIMGSKEFKDFFEKVRATGERPSKSDIINVAKLFNNDLTLTNLSRPQLVSMCRYMALNAFGTDNFLRTLITNRLDQLKRDDTLIQAEGIDELSTAELQQACQSRGIHNALSHSPARLRSELATWIDLHINEGVSGALLILSRAFAFDRRISKSTEEDLDPIILSLETVLSGLPDQLVNEAEIGVEPEQASYKQMLEVLEQQEELIEDEEEQEQKALESKKARKEAEERAKAEEEAQMVKMLLPDSELKTEQDDARMTMEQVKELGEALTVLSSKSSVLKERDILRELVDGSTQTDPDSALAKRVNKMLDTIDKQLDAYDGKVGSKLQLISCDPQGRIPIRDLKQALRVIRHAPDEEDVDAIVAKLDVDKDGFVQLEHVLELAREEGMGVDLDEDARSILGQGKEIKDLRPKKADIVQEEE